MPSSSRGQPLLPAVKVVVYVYQIIWRHIKQTGMHREITKTGTQDKRTFTTVNLTRENAALRYIDQRRRFVTEYRRDIATAVDTMPCRVHGNAITDIPEPPAEAFRNTFNLSSE